MSSRRKSPVEPEAIEPPMCSPAMRHGLLKRMPYFAMLADAAIDDINEQFVERGFAAGESIYFAGDPAERLYVMASGKVKLIRHTLTGQDVVLDILAKGDFFGHLSGVGGQTYADTAIAQTVVCALGIDASGFRDVLQRYPPVALEALNVTSQRLHDAQETIRQLSANSTEQRLAYTLLRLADKLGEAQAVGDLIQMPLTREDLAAMTGSTPETVSRIMRQFQKGGWIASGRRWIALRDRAALQAIAAG